MAEPDRGKTHEQLQALNLGPEYTLRLSRAVVVADAVAAALEAYRLAIHYVEKQTPSLALRAAATGDRHIARARRELERVGEWRLGRQ